MANRSAKVMAGARSGSRAGSSAWVVAAAGLAAALGMASCSDSAGPEPELTWHFVHAATASAGTFELEVDGEVVDAALEPGEVATATVRGTSFNYRFSGSTGAVIEANPTFSSALSGAEYAVLLRDPWDLTIRVSREPTQIPEEGNVAVRVITLAFGLPADAVMRIGDELSLFELSYGSDGRTIGTTQGTYEVVVEWDGGTETADLGTVTLAEGTSFLVLLPDVEGLPGGVVAF